MDSEDSQNSSSGNESNDEGCQTPVSTKSQGAYSNKSIASCSRSSSPGSRVHSALSHHSPNLQEGPHSPDDSYHSKNGSHHSLEESQHSLIDSYSQEERVPMEDTNPLDVKENCALESQMTTKEKYEHSKEDNFSDHSLADSNSSSNFLKGKKNRETDIMKTTVANNATIKSRSRSRSTSVSSDDNDVKSCSSNHIPTTDNLKHLSKIDSNDKLTSHYSVKTLEVNKSPKGNISDDDNDSVKSDSSLSSRSSRASGKSEGSVNSSSVDSRSKKSRKKSQSSASSETSGNSSPEKSCIKSPDTHAEEISDGKYFT